MALNPTAISLNGSSRYIKLSPNVSIKNMTAFTWMAWVKPGTLANSPYKRLYVERQGTGSRIRFAANAYHSRIRFEFSPQDGISDTNYDYAYEWDDRWHHIAFGASVTGTTPSYEIFLDGISVASGKLVVPAGLTAISNTAPYGGVTWIGNHSLHVAPATETLPSDRYWHGKVAEVLLFDEKKNQSDILAYVTSNNIWDMGDTAMFSYWRFEQGTGEGTGNTTIVDADNASWTGTLHSTDGILTSALYTIDRPFLGNGTVDTTPPSTPTFPATIVTGITDDKATINWNASTDNVFVQYYELATSYLSDFSTGTPGSPHNAGQNLSYRIKDLLPGQPVYYRVRAFDAEGNVSAWTATNSFNTSSSGDLTAPNTATGLTASQISHSSFRVSWTASTSPDEAGYHIDVSTSPQFTTYLNEYRNRDVGNVLFTDVFGAQPLTTYYVRLRTYDEAGNESVESQVLVVQTTSQPDTTAPLAIEPYDPTSITYNAFTANWAEGIDDVGIASYYLDIAYDSAFVTPLVTTAVTWSNVNVGNVTSYRVTGAPSDTQLYYRVRAVDGAGNVSLNYATPMGVKTTHASINEGGYLTNSLNPTGDGMVSSAAATTNYHNSATTLTIVGNGTTATQLAYIAFDLSEVAGSIESAILRLNVENASTGTLNVRATAGTINETTLTYNTRPTMTGSTLTINPSTVAVHSIDIGSLLVSGNVPYVIELSTISTDNILVSASHTATPEELEIESDPSKATLVEEGFIYTDYDGSVLNYVMNPHGEINITTGWVAYGTGVTLATSTTSPWVGTRTLTAATNGASANQGIEYSRTNVSTVQDDEWTVTVMVRCLSGTMTTLLQINEYTSAGAVLASVSTPVTLTTTFQRVTLSRKIASATAAQMSFLIITTGTAQSGTIVIGQSTLNKGLDTSMLFDGNTSSATWTNSANLSTSRLNSSYMRVESTYVGDEDGDNSVRGMIRQSGTLDWIYLDAISETINRGTKRVTVDFRYGYEYNMLRNPSMELNTTGWLANAGSTILRTDEYADSGSYSLRVGITGSGQGATSESVYMGAAVAATYRVRVWIPAGITVQATLRTLNSAGTELAASTPVAGTSSFAGANRWETLTGTYTTPANTNRVYMHVYSTTAATTAFFIDSAMIARGSGTHVNPYLDGDSFMGRWEGVPHASSTFLMFPPETLYDVRHEYTDADGIVGYDVDTVAFSEEHMSIPAPDTATTLNPLFLTAGTESIDYELSYSGDSNATMTARVEWKRTDLSTWTAVPPIYDRVNKKIRGTISTLKAGTNYTVRVTATDVDGVFGTNPATTNITTGTNQQTSESTSRISFGGFMLMGRADAKIGVDSQDAFGLPERRVQVEPLPRVDGAIELSNLWGSRRISMRGFVEGETRAELEDNKNALKRALAPKLQPLVIDTLANQGRFYYATCESLSIVEEGGVNIRHLVWEADFICADPFAYDSELTIIPEFTAAHNQSVYATNVGDLRVDPTIKVRTTFTGTVTVTIYNETTGERITPLTTITNGDRLLIDTSRLALYKNGVEIDYSGGFPHLTTGSNKFTFSLTAPVGIPTVLVEMSWRHRYL